MMEEVEFEAAVGMSRKWDAREAGREVARETIKKLSRPPSFFLLFSTIHYEKHGGFQEFLNGVWDVLPEGTPLIGGTLAGFINPQGCYTRGATALAVSYPRMDIAVGLGRNTKRSPQKAAITCAEMLKKNLKSSIYENKFILDFVSSGLVPHIPGVGRTMIIRSKVLSSLSPRLLDSFGKLMQTGTCRQDEILNELIKQLPDYSLMSGGTTDDVSQLRNYQFVKTNIFSNSICALGLNLDVPVRVHTTHGLVETDRNFEITSLDHSKRVIKSIDGKPAVPRLFEILHLNEDDLNEHIFRKIFYLPFGFKKNDGTVIPVVACIFLGDYFFVIFQVENKDATVLNLSGRGLLGSIDEHLDMCNDQTKLALFSACAMRLLALGNNSYAIYKKIKEKLKDIPFIVYFVGGEATYSQNQGLQYGNYLFSSTIF
jgi:hypothetical protein